MFVVIGTQSKYFIAMGKLVKGSKVHPDVRSFDTLYSSSACPAEPARLFAGKY